MIFDQKNVSTNPFKMFFLSLCVDTDYVIISALIKTTRVHVKNPECHVLYEVVSIDTSTAE